MVVPQKTFAEDLLEFLGESLFGFEEADQGTYDICIIGPHIFYFLLVRCRCNAKQ